VEMLEVALPLLWGADGVAEVLALVEALRERAAEALEPKFGDSDGDTEAQEVGDWVGAVL
jgi:hypothetical protein